MANRLLSLLDWGTGIGLLSAGAAHFCIGIWEFGFGGNPVGGSVLMLMGLVVGRFAFSVVFVREHKPGHCLKCDYDLTGNVSGRCPECGIEVEVD